MIQEKGISLARGFQTVSDDQANAALEEALAEPEVEPKLAYLDKRNRTSSRRLGSAAPLWNGYWAQPSREHRNRLVEYYLPFAKAIADLVKSKLPPTIDIDDLYSVANLGLIESIEKYDPTKRVKFETYTSWRIRGSCLDFLRQSDWVPRNVRQWAARANRTREQFMAQFGREPNEEEWAQRLDMKLEDFRRQKGDLLPLAVRSIEVAGIDENDESYTSNRIMDTRAVQPEQLAQRKEFLDHIMKGLQKIEAEVLIGYYLKHKTMLQIAEELQISESRVCQLRKQFLKFLRTKFADRLSDFL